jgi:hypothetical protein
MNNAEKLFGGVNFKSEAGYAEIAPTTTVVELRPEGKKQPLLLMPQFSFEPGKTYTIVVMGRQKDHKLEAVTVEDHFVGSYASRCWSRALDRGNKEIVASHSLLSVSGTFRKSR